MGRLFASALILLLPLAVACGERSAEPAREAVSPPVGDVLYIEDARAVPSPGGRTGVVYLTLANPTGEDDVLRSVSTPAAKVAEVHETIQGENGMVRMEAFPEGLPVPAGARVELTPGGKHLMLLALDGPMAPGEEIEVALTFDRAGERVVRVPVRESVLP